MINLGEGLFQKTAEVTEQHLQTQNPDLVCPLSISEQDSFAALLKTSLGLPTSVLKRGASLYQSMEHPHSVAWDSPSKEAHREERAVNNDLRLGLVQTLVVQHVCSSTPHAHLFLH